MAVGAVVIFAKPLVGQKLAAVHPKEATAMMSACIVAAQLVMLPIALLVGHTADTWGRKPLFLAGLPFYRCARCSTRSPTIVSG
jgi:MFS family permease